MKLLKISGVIIAVFFVLIGILAVVLLTLGYRPIICPSTYPNWEAVGALGQWGGVIVAIFIPIVTFYMGKRIEKSVDNASNQTSRTMKMVASQNNPPNTTEYCSSSTNGVVKFDYSNNNGRYCIGENDFMFEVAFSKASDQNIYVYNDPNSIITVALVEDTLVITEISNASKYDTSSRTRCPKINQVVILQNINTFYAAIKILSIQDDSRGALNDEVTFEYIIQTNGSEDFTDVVV